MGCAAVRQGSRELTGVTAQSRRAGNRQPNQTETLQPFSVFVLEVCSFSFSSNSLQPPRNFRVALPIERMNAFLRL